MSQANVYTSVSSQTWYTDKCRIITGATAVTYNVNMITGTPDTGNIFSAVTAVPAQAQTDIWVGVGNELTITGANFHAQELGTASSGSQSVRQV